MHAVCVCARTYMHKQREGVKISTSPSFPYSLETGSLTAPGAHCCFSRLVPSIPQRISCLSSTPKFGTAKIPCHAQLLMWVPDLNSGPYACSKSTLWAGKPPPPPHPKPWKQFLGNGTRWVILISKYSFLLVSPVVTKLLCCSGSHTGDGCGKTAGITESGIKSLGFVLLQSERCMTSRPFRVSRLCRPKRREFPAEPRTNLSSFGALWLYV